MERLTRESALDLYLHAPTAELGRMADAVRRQKHPRGVVTYIIDRNVNYTNVCIEKCAFCAFYRDVGHQDGYTLSFAEIFRKIEETISLGGQQLLLQGGHNPDVPLAWYLDLFREVKTRFPSFRLHALSPPEVIHISRLSKLSTKDVLRQLIDAGLDSVPGGGAEILVDRVRKLLHCYHKATADQWLAVMREAHQFGLRTTATMMYGTVETAEERLEHMFRLRELQDETGGFQTFIPLAFHPENTGLSHIKKPSGIMDLRTMAVSRLMLDNFDHVKAYWIMLGIGTAQTALAYGADDLDGTVRHELIYHDAGAKTPEILSVEDIRRLIAEAGREPIERDTLYHRVIREGANWRSGEALAALP